MLLLTHTTQRTPRIHVGFVFVTDDDTFPSTTAADTTITTGTERERERERERESNNPTTKTIQ